MSDIDSIIGSLENPYDDTTAPQGDGIPRVQWRNGEARTRQPGRHVDPTRPGAPDPAVIAAMTPSERTDWEA